MTGSLTIAPIFHLYRIHNTEYRIQNKHKDYTCSDLPPVQSTEYITRITLALFFHLYPASVGPLSHNQAMCCTKSDSCGLCFQNIPHFSLNLRQPQSDHVCLLVEVEKAETEDSANSDTCKDRCSRMGGNPCSVPEVDSIFFIFVLNSIILFSSFSNSGAVQEVVPILIFLGNKDYL